MVFKVDFTTEYLFSSMSSDLLALREDLARMDRELGEEVEESGDRTELLLYTAVGLSAMGLAVVCGCGALYLYKTRNDSTVVRQGSDFFE